MSKTVLVVTDYVGNLHITPASNKGYYQSKNVVVKDKQFKFKEGLTEDEANDFVLKNNGIDPDFLTPSKATAVIANKDAENEELKKKLSALQQEIDEVNKKTATQVGPSKAEDVIAKIGIATTEEEVNNLIAGETRKTVVDAGTKRLEDLKK